MRLIDADALRDEWLYENGTFEANDVLDSIDCQPTIDAVPVVWCRECKYCYAEGFVNVRNVCEKHYDFGNVDDDWFCADGKRKDGERDV